MKDFDDFFFSYFSLKLQQEIQKFLVHPLLLQKLHNPDQQVLYLLSQFQTIKQLLIYSLGFKELSKDDIYTYTQKATYVLSIKNDVLQNVFYQNSGFRGVIENFFSLCSSCNPSFYKNYVKIFIAYFYYYKGQFLLSLPKFHLQMLNNIQYLPIQYLYKLILDYPNQNVTYLFYDYPVFSKFIQNGTSSSYTVVGILQDIKKNNSSYPFMYNSTFLFETLIKQGLNTKGSISFRIQCYQIASDIWDKTPEISYSHIIKKYEDYFQIVDQQPVKNAGYLIFDKYLPYAANEFFMNLNDTFLAQAFVKKLKQLDSMQLIKFVQDNAIQEKLIESFGKSKINGQITEIIEYLQKKNILLTPEFLQFISAQFKPHLKKLTCVYSNNPLVTQNSK